MKDKRGKFQQKLREDNGIEEYCGSKNGSTVWAVEVGKIALGVIGIECRNSVRKPSKQEIEECHSRRNRSRANTYTVRNPLNENLKNAAVGVKGVDRIPTVRNSLNEKLNKWGILQKA